MSFFIPYPNGCVVRQDYHRHLSLGEAGSEISEEHVLWIPFIPYLSGGVVRQDYHWLLSLGETGSEI
jgi:hypothetical protein